MSSKINLQTCEYARKSSIFQDNQLISNTSYIYAVQPDNFSADILADNIETFIKDNKIYGCYYVNILNSAPDQSYSGDSLRKYVREKNEMVIAQREVNMEKAEH